MKKALFLVSLIPLAACSNQAGYHAMQQNAINRCAELPPSQYEACVAEARKPYREYQREREALLEADPDGNPSR